MSNWDQYRDNLCSSADVHKVIICGLDGSIWTKSDGIDIQPNEITDIIAGFRNNSNLQSNGIKIGGQKYLYIQSDDSQIQGKKGPSGISISKSNQCMIIATYREGMQAGNTRKVVESMVDYLRQSNY